jgi:hypothetical protein
MAAAHSKARRIGCGVLESLLICGLLALGIGTLASGKYAIGALCLTYAAWAFSTWLIARRGSERAMLRVVLMRPFFLGAWLLALAVLIIAERTSLDWVVILPLALAWLALGVGLLIVARRSRRRDGAS